jgi:maleate isomerase
MANLPAAQTVLPKNNSKPGSTGLSCFYGSGFALQERVILIFWHVPETVPNQGFIVTWFLPRPGPFQANRFQPGRRMQSRLPPFTTHGRLVFPEEGGVGFIHWGTDPGSVPQGSHATCYTRQNHRGTMGEPARKKTDNTVMLEHLPFDMDAGIAARASIGLIVLATDYTIEYEWRQLFAGIDGVSLYHSRIYNENNVTPDTLRAMQPRIADCAGIITPDTGVDVIAYGCTSASMAIGENAVFENIRRARPESRCTTPITAAFAAFDAFRARRIGVLTPYTRDVNRIMADYIVDRGYQVPVFGSFNEELDSNVARITPDSIERGVREIIRHAAVDMIFVSCTSVRLMAACAEIESHLDVPLTSSNHAMGWHALRLAEIDDDLSAFGALYGCSL